MMMGEQFKNLTIGDLTPDLLGKTARYTGKGARYTTTVEGPILGIRVDASLYCRGGRDAPTSVVPDKGRVLLDDEWYTVDTVQVEDTSAPRVRVSLRTANVWHSFDEVPAGATYVQGNNGVTYSRANNVWWKFDYNLRMWVTLSPSDLKPAAFVPATPPNSWESLLQVPPHVNYVSNDAGVEYTRIWGKTGFTSHGHTIDCYWKNNAAANIFGHVPAKKLRGPYYA